MKLPKCLVKSFVTFRQNRETGLFMTSNFPILDNQRLISTHGMLFIGIYGSRQWLIFVANHNLPVTQRSILGAPHTPGLASPFQKNPAGHFMPADTVRIVSNVAQITLPASARLPNNMLLSPKNDQLLQILHSNPVTPVKTQPPKDNPWRPCSWKMGVETANSLTTVE